MGIVILFITIHHFRRTKDHRQPAVSQRLNSRIQHLPMDVRELVVQRLADRIQGSHVGHQSTRIRVGASL